MDNKYIIIGRSTCHFCALAVDLCKAKKIKHTFLDYVENLDILEDYKSSHQQETVPIILSNNLETGIVHKIGGYTDLLEQIVG